MGAHGTQRRTANGTHVVTWVCNNDANQLWQQQPNNTWKNPVSNRCLDIVGSGTAAGTFVQLWDCTGAANQIWVPQADGTLKNPNSNRCLDTGANPATQQRLRIENCNATAVTQQWVAGIPDSDGLNGFTAEERTLDGTVEVVTTYHEPTVIQTATRDSPEAGGQDLTALMTTETATRARTRIAATNSWRWTETTKTYDSYGLPTQTRLVGDTAVATDDTCITFAYARNTTKFLIDYPSQSVTRAGSTCAPGDPRILENRIFYDGTTTLGAAPTAGLATRNQTLASQSPSEVWASTDTGYDIYGRSTSVTDARGGTTTTAYTPTTGGPVLQTTITNPLGHTVVTTLDGHRGLPLSITDANGRTTSGEYDPLGRLTRVRQPGSSPPNPPDIEYAYTLSASGANSVTTKHLGPNGNQIATHELYDGRLRPRQTQQPGPQANGGRIITDTAYDGRGLAVKTSTFWNNAAPSTTLASFADAAVPSQTRATYDNRKRTTAGQLWSLGTMKWETTTAYDGDRTMVTPPGGGIPTTTLVNAGGNTVELRQHTSGATNGPYQATSYTYDPIGRLTQVTDPAGNRWTTTYDTGSRITSTTDPDKGETENVHNAAGDLLSSTDARGVTLSYAYDDLGRRTQLWQGDVGTGTKRAEWFFDTLADGTNVKGHPVKSVRWHDNEAYSSEVTSVDPMYRPLTTKMSLPASMTTLAGPWVTTSTYKPNGSLATRTLPAAGSLPEETITYSYDNAGYPLTMAGLDTYISSTAYYNWGGIHQKTLGTGTKRVQIQTTVDEATLRLTENRISTENQTTPNTWTPQLVEQYGYDNAGNVKTIKEIDAGGTTVSNQCFNHDGLRRLTEAWTTTTACQPAPAQAVVAGPDPYWNSYRYDAIGNRTQDTVHTPGGDTTRDYTYPASGPNSVRPHAINSITATGLTTGTDTYTYDDAGNTATRNIAGKPGQTLTWDPEDHLASLTDIGGTTSYIYTANGQRLVADEPGSTTTVYLGGFELRRTTTGVTATRHYGVAARTTSAGLTWLATDHHNTGQLSIHPTTLATTRRKSDPFGKTRGAAAAWPTTRGFVNGIQDPTGLVHLGAREYEPDTGRFISVDPVMDLSDPTQWNGYTYSNSNPTTFSDPSGLSFDSTPGMGDGLINNGPPAPYIPPTTNNNAGNPTSTKKSSCNWVCKAKKAGKAALDVVNGVSEDIIYGTVDAVQGRWNEFTQTYHENGWQAAANWVVWNVAFTPTAGFRTFHELSNSIWNGYKGAAASTAQGHYVDSARQAIGATIALATLVAPVVAGKGPGAGAGPKTPKAGGAPKTGGPKGGGPASGPAKSSPPVKAAWEGNSPHRLPEEWGEGQPNRKGGPGWRWLDPEIPRRAGVRIDKAKPGVDNESQWVDHVVVRDGGRVIGRDGKPLRGAKNADAHIPLIEWEQWSAWNKKE